MEQCFRVAQRLPAPRDRRPMKEPIQAVYWGVLAQVPHFHALRYVNAVATFSTISFSFIAVVVSIYDGAPLNPSLNPSLNP